MKKILVSSTLFFPEATKQLQELANLNDKYVIVSPWSFASDNVLQTIAAIPHIKSLWDEAQKHADNSNRDLIYFGLAPIEIEFDEHIVIDPVVSEVSMDYLQHFLPKEQKEIFHNELKHIKEIEFKNIKEAIDYLKEKGE